MSFPHCVTVTVVLWLCLSPATASTPLLQLVADYADYRALSAINIFISGQSGRFSKSELASLLVTLTSGRERYVAVHYIPLASSHLSDVMASTGRAVGAAEFLLLTDDDVSLQFLQMVHSSQYMTADYAWFAVSERTRVRKWMSKFYLPVNSQLVIAELSGRISSWTDGSTPLAADLVETYRLRERLAPRSAVIGRWRHPGGGERARGTMTAWTNGSIYERRQDWSGLELHVTTVGDPPFIRYYKSPTPDVGGYIGELWKQLAKIMKFKYRVTYSIDNDWGTLLPDGGWTGVVGMLQRREVDVSVTDLSVTEPRSAVIDYSSGLMFIRMRMFIKKPSALDVSWTTYLDVFDLRLWFVLICTIVIGSTAMFGMYRLERRLGLRQDGSGVFSWRDSLLHFFGALCQQGAEGLPQGNGTRFFFWFFYISMVTVFAAYSAMLVSFLAVQTMNLPFQDVEGLLEDGTYKLGIRKGTSQLDYFRLSPNPLLRRVYERHVVPMSSNEEGYQRVTSDRFAFLDTYEVAVLTKGCDVIDIKRDYFKHMVAFGFQEGSPYTTFINFQLSRMDETGLMSQLLARHWQHLDSCESEVLNGLGLPAVFSAFVLLVGGVGAALLIMLLECIWARLRRNHRRRSAVTAGPVVISSKTAPAPGARFGTLQEHQELQELQDIFVRRMEEQDIFGRKLEQQQQEMHERKTVGIFADFTRKMPLETSPYNLHDDTTFASLWRPQTPPPAIEEPRQSYSAQRRESIWQRLMRDDDSR